MTELIEGWQRQKFRFTRGENASEFIPTWDVGREQNNPNNLRKFAEEGYQGNSLIYSCIKEKATSFAALPPIVVRADGAVAKDARLIELLNDPNTHQDGQDFAELMMTQYEACGNVYVWKVRASANKERRAKFAGFPVQELRLIRPDYVKIQPGPTPDQDIFVVEVGGNIAARIPRLDMIHIHEPNLVNDFYGLSKVALITRQSDIDIAMSDFELSFFRNAGVPMGILKVKGKMTPEQTTEIKGRFRQAFNGFRNWFNVLVLNMDESEYVPLGIKQSDMEAESTRFQLEARICSVFGVPPVIVGARVATSGGVTIGYPDAEHAFWAETMVPAAMRFGRAWQKFLLPEFATTELRGATVTYDFTVVRALQEDRSRKLREVVRLVLTGGFTINEALESVGMQRIPTGDFYIRNGNQVIVELDGTITPMSDGGGKNPNNPLEGAALLERQVEGILREAGA